MSEKLFLLQLNYLEKLFQDILILLFIDNKLDYFVIKVQVRKLKYKINKVVVVFF